jgi:glycosyltransferase involved in cell wall biosynthesis
MSGNGAVTIVIPTFNRADWLEGAVASVLEQDYENLDVLVVDDGSTDATATILERIAAGTDPARFSFIRQENAGQAAALNRGWGEARGDLVGYLSDDDRLLPGAIGRLAAELAAAEDAVISYPGYHVIDENDAVLDTIRPMAYSPLAGLRLHDTAIGPGALIRKAVIEERGGWEPEFRWMGDFVLWMKLASGGRTIRVAEPLAVWRRHSGAATTLPSFEHALEHLAVFIRGSEILGPDLTPADRSEALRNACVIGAFFGGEETRARESDFIAVDLQRPELSAYAAGIGVEEVPDERADEVALLWRDLAAKTVVLVESRSRSAGAELPAGLQRAEQLLERAGAWTSGPDLDRESRLRLGAAMSQAAFHCGAEFDPRTGRFLFVRRGGVLEPAEEELLQRLALIPTRAGLEEAEQAFDRALGGGRDRRRRWRRRR